MGQRFDWWRLGLGSIVVGAALMTAWEFLLEDAVFDWLGLSNRAESLHEKITYIAMGTMATALIITGLLVAVRLRVSAEEKIRQSEERFRLVFQESPGLFAMTRASDGLHYDVNEQWVKTLGYARQEVIGRTAAEIGVWADADERRRLMEALAGSASLRNFEARLKTKDGRIIPVLAAVEKVTMDGEEQIFIVSQEITELKKVEEALRASEGLLRGILDNMQDIYYRTDRDGRFVKISPAIKEILGYAPGEVLGRQVAEFYWNPHEEKPFRELMKKSGGRIREHEMNFRHRDGRSVWLWTNGQYLYDASGAVIGIEGTSRDITERKKAQQALTQFKMTLDQTLDCVFMFEPESLRFVYVNRGALEQVGYSEAEMLQMTPLDIKPGYDEARFRALINPLQDGTKNVQRFETIHRHKDGHSVPVEISLQFISLADSQGHFVAIVRDITARRRVEAELQAAHDELEIRVQERTRELKDALAKVSETSRAKSDFLANMSHELRTPMNAILGFSDMLAKEALGPMGNPRYRDYAADIYESGQHLLSLINELLDLARIEARTLELRDDIVDVGTLIRSAIHMCEVSAKAGAVSTHITAAASLPRLRGDELRLTQVFLNLIGNALKFTPAGGRVEIRYGLAGNGGIEVVIADTGPGIAPEDIERVQTPFARGRQPFIRTKEGLGLGLPLAKAFMEAHGGTLDVASTAGQGTTIALKFPADRIIPR